MESYVSHTVDFLLSLRRDEYTTKRTQIREALLQALKLDAQSAEKMIWSKARRMNAERSHAQHLLDDANKLQEEAQAIAKQATELRENVPKWKIEIEQMLHEDDDYITMMSTRDASKFEVSIDELMNSIRDSYATKLGITLQEYRINVCRHRCKNVFVTIPPPSKMMSSNYMDWCKPILTMEYFMYIEQMEALKRLMGGTLTNADADADVDAGAEC
jgi:hypothetical protein